MSAKQRANGRPSDQFLEAIMSEHDGMDSAAGASAQNRSVPLDQTGSQAGGQTGGQTGVHIARLCRVDGDQSGCQTRCESLDQPVQLARNESLEMQIEADPALVPSTASRLLVSPTVLEAEEVAALLGGLSNLLRNAEIEAALIIGSGSVSTPFGSPAGGHKESQFAGQHAGQFASACAGQLADQSAGQRAHQFAGQFGQLIDASAVDVTGVPAISRDARRLL